MISPLLLRNSWLFVHKSSIAKTAFNVATNTLDAFTLINRVTLPTTTHQFGLEAEEEVDGVEFIEMINSTRTQWESRSLCDILLCSD